MIRRFLIKEFPEGMDQIQPYPMQHFVHCFSPAMYYVQDNDQFSMIYEGTSVTGGQHVEIKLTFDKYAHDRYKAVGCHYDRDRYPIPLEDGRTAFVDYCRTPYPGMQFIEVEFDDEADAAAFAPPAWFGKEVTENSEFSFLQICHAPV